MGSCLGPMYLRREPYGYKEGLGFRAWGYDGYKEGDKESSTLSLAFISRRESKVFHTEPMTTATLPAGRGRFFAGARPDQYGTDKGRKEQYLSACESDCKQRSYCHVTCLNKDLKPRKLMTSRSCKAPELIGSAMDVRRDFLGKPSGIECRHEVAEVPLKLRT